MSSRISQRIRMRRDQRKWANTRSATRRWFQVSVIPEKVDQAANRKKSSRGCRPVGHDAELNKERNTVERLINKLKAWRGIATRYDKTPDSYPAGSTYAPR
ncbi:hypothetical protein LJ657_13825 [Streptomyces sp. NR30]|uniref:Transposase DDE domain-containing protein n=1 Tax=Streptomyces guryensis TaxID=2886947 RepID=A0A9Q3VN54_9ACTN|nr:hypothetical protein [Streptomyces guryensis]MCD9874742.1 hypothetical protein [Streptomyces guryensis]